MTSMRSELGRVELNNLFQLRKELNEKIRQTLEETTQSWGIECDRYEILKLEPPTQVRKSMQLQAEAERTRRKDIIISEANKISSINQAEGIKARDILNAEAQAESVEIKARAEKDGLKLISTSISDGKSKGLRTLDYILKTKYYEKYSEILKKGSVTVLPDSSEGGSDVLAAVALMMKHNQPGKPQDEPRSQSNTV